ncbi:unnamed protein product [Rotaria socialis]|uniref:Hemicentin-1-like von Willebrand factor A domain-containing protein n=1 Tax=Rotaria socialis TaxID=392032 RepID=A0A818B5C8_9BILA|nr:unnamed protein product [Rotaria socialis]CAF3414006.1 unnamed protein product [Rotaria socialis]CAF4300675.1 unnamed protein product [Rotaria socialis]CAF4412104.1 unnamed protein product [Rotaria socialis]CAF4624514.1 unnamed protein product [Rotaria socialis]
MASKPVSDTVDSIRLKERKPHASVTVADFPSQPLPTQSSSDSFDLDIDALDAEFRSLTLDQEKNIQQLRADPHNPAKKTSKEGRRLLDENEKDLDQRKYEIDQALKVITAQSAADVWFIMDCTESMGAYIAAAKNSINILTKTLTALFKIPPRLAFIGYRDVSDGANKLIRMNFTTDVGTFQKVLGNIAAFGGGDECEDVFGGIQAVAALQW